ncbi:MAG: hypothetical protein F2842_07765 [Actinobacteria bacterium]|uniref:Unannotated protein n=1 Tax=freshwater metagenome TaxID=449393 RepID=A0A6J7KDI3_9ZZZZ|nr:hypothetical protein [Actinomycetota bacterium]
MSTTELTPQERRFESERIHASAQVLLLAAIGLAIFGVGKLVGSAAFGMGYSQVGSTIAFVGTVVVLISLVLHVDHLSFRLGLSAIVLVILCAIVLGVAQLLGAFNVGRINGWLVGAGWVLGGVGLAMVAVHKEGQMKATLTDYASGAPWQARVTVHASFLTLITAAIGLVLYGVGAIGLTNAAGRGPLVLMSVGGVLAAIGVISHVEHLVPRIGLVAVIAGILSPLFWAASTIPNAIDPSNSANGSVTRLCLGIGALLGALACALAFAKKLSTDR